MPNSNPSTVGTVDDLLAGGVFPLNESIQF
jgi:hypothetical protein